MRPCKIQLSGAALMLLLLSGAASLLPQRSVAQCAMNFAPTTEVHSVSVTGDGGSVSTLTLPKFLNPSGYTFLGADIEVYLTTTATITFTNTVSTTQTFNPAIGRSDELDLNGSYLNSGSASKNMPHTVLNTLGDTKTYTGFSAFSSNNIISNNVVAGDPNLVPDYEGAGNLNLTYIPSTFVNFVPTPQVSFNTPPPVISDNINVVVTYSYCGPVTLASNITVFTAVRQNNQTVALNWTVSNEEAGKTYYTQVSTDGLKYTSFQTLPSDAVNGQAVYTGSYGIQPGAAGKLFFRIWQKSASGQAAYSQVRVIDLGTGTVSGFSIYPNPPTDYINLLFPAGSDGWQVDLLSADGSLVQRNYFHNTTTGLLNFDHKLSSGTYFARATNMQTAQSHVAPFVIR